MDGTAVMRSSTLKRVAALVTYRYQEGEFTLLIVSPIPDLRRTIAERIDGSRVKVVITTP